MRWSTSRSRPAAADALLARRYADTVTNDGRAQTDIDRIAEQWVDTLAELAPEVGTYIGRLEGQDRYSDLSPEGTERYRSALAATLAALEAAQTADRVDEITKMDLGAELRLSIEGIDAGFQLRDVNVIASAAQDIRQVYDLMPTESDDDWATVSARLGNVRGALEGYRRTLELGVERGITPAARQIRAVAEQMRAYAKPDGFFASFASDARAGSRELPASLRRELSEHAAQAASAYGELADWFEGTLLEHAAPKDGIGRELYSIASRRFLGAAIDLDETYEWGIEELGRMVAEQDAVAQQITPGGTVLEAIAALDRDPGRKLHGTEALQRWMQDTSDRAVAELGATHFDIPEPVRELECMIAPTQEGGIYYTGPTDDFSRPGRMWWSVPEGVTEFNTWRELTTVYHEGVPGHHLQIGQAVYNRAELNSWRRLLAGSSGHAEGWALYAERLMQELGYLDDPGDLLGMLDGQRMRAARVVLDLGVHLGKPRLDGTGEWDYAYALDFFREHVHMDDEFIKFEVNRYFGWPGQAPSYKVGQRIWEQIRDEVALREGESYRAKAFHKRALDIGGVGLDTLRAALLG